MSVRERKRRMKWRQMTAQMNQTQSWMRKVKTLSYTQKQVSLKAVWTRTRLEWFSFTPNVVDIADVLK